MLLRLSLRLLHRLERRQLPSPSTLFRPPAPISGTQFLNAATSVQAQLHGSNGACYETTFTPVNVIKNNGAQFKAKF